MIWVYAGVALLAVAAVGGAYLQGEQAGKASCEAAAAREERVARAAGDAAASAAAAAIVRIQVRHTTIRQEAEREIQVRTEYRDCRHSAEQLQRINAALGAAEPKPPGGGSVPAPEPAGR